jgi:hypothetical protein
MRWPGIPTRGAAPPALGGTAGQVCISGNRASGDFRHRNPRYTVGCTFRAADAGSGAAQPRHRPRLPVIRPYSGIRPDGPPSCACIGAGQTPSCRQWRFAGQLPASIEPRSASHYGMSIQLPVRATIEAVSHQAPPHPRPFRLSRQYRGRCAHHRATAHRRVWSAATC